MHARGGASSNRPDPSSTLGVDLGASIALKRDGMRSRFLIAHDLFGKPLRTFPDHALAGFLKDLGDAFPHRLAGFHRKPLGQLPQLLVLRRDLVETLARLRGGQCDDVRDRLAGQQMGKEIDRSGGIGVRNLDDLETVVGRAPGGARIGFLERFRHSFRRTLHLLAAFLRASDALLGEIAEHAGQRELECERRHTETVRGCLGLTVSHHNNTLHLEIIVRGLLEHKEPRAAGCPASTSVCFFR